MHSSGGTVTVITNILLCLFLYTILDSPDKAKGAVKLNWYEPVDLSEKFDRRENERIEKLRVDQRSTFPSTFV